MSLEKRNEQGMIFPFFFFCVVTLAVRWGGGGGGGSWNKRGFLGRMNPLSRGVAEPFPPSSFDTLPHVHLFLGEEGGCFVRVVVAAFWVRVSGEGGGGGAWELPRLDLVGTHATGAKSTHSPAHAKGEKATSCNCIAW